MRIHDPGKAARILTIVTLSFMIFWQTLLLLFPLKPFWRDEWCIIYNIKFKTAKMLWWPLDFTQQFPRLYLQIIKCFTSFFNYNYFSLRFPAYITGVAAIFFCWALAGKLYRGRDIRRYLFILILVSSQVFMDYFVQIKQYEMELLLSLVAIWQLLALTDIPHTGIQRPARYFLLCLSFAVVPYFSYTYPIAVAPVFMVVFIQNLYLLTDKANNPIVVKNLLLQWLPLIICMATIAVFYIIDISQLMTDQNMHNYWKFRMVAAGDSPVSFINHIWRLFSKVGSGFVFEIVFGILGVSAFFYSGYFIRSRDGRFGKEGLIRLYCLALILIVIALFVAGKLPLGEPKFNAFAIPSISVLIIFLLDKLSTHVSFRKFASGLYLVLFVALSGNIFAGFFNNLTSPEYAKRIRIYLATEKALALAHDRKIPVFITPSVGFPDDITVNFPFISMPSAAGVLKTFPGYHTGDTIAIYTVSNIGQFEWYKGLLPPGTRSVIVGDGLTYQVKQW
jgi:hypothetical protein